MLRTNSPDSSLLDNRVTQLIASHRKILFVMVGLLYVIGFNGQWRVGLDSANYRGLAMNIATGKGYVFGNWVSNQAYPGWPAMLAGIERLLGPADRTPGDAETARLLGPSLATTTSVLLVLAMAMLTLAIVYKLIGLHYPRWVAVTITCGVGSNALFLQFANELMTDMPFLLGVVMSLYGWDRLLRAKVSREQIRVAVVLVIGLALAASTRPTFWILAIAWVMTCAWGFVFCTRQRAVAAANTFGGSRKFYAACLGALLVVWAGLILVDPRFRGFHPFGGGYEQDAMEIAPRALQSLGKRMYAIAHDQLPPALFGEKLAPLSVLGSIVIVASTFLLLRRHLMWVLLTWGTLAVTLLLSDEPRYYLMVLPIFMLSWLAMICSVARRMNRRGGEVVLVLGLALVVLNNLSASVSFLAEQRRSDFLKHYKNGSYVPIVAMSREIREHLKPGDKVLGPAGAIMSLLSGVHVYTQKEILPKGPDSGSPRRVADVGLDFVVVPWQFYRSKEPVIANLLSRRYIRARQTIATTHGMRLATIQVTVPASGDWRKLGKRPRRPVRAPATRPAGS